MAKLLALIVPAIETNQVNAAVTKSPTTTVRTRIISHWRVIRPNWFLGVGRFQGAPNDQNAVITKRFGLGLAHGRIKRFFGYPRTPIDGNRRSLPRRGTLDEMLQATPAERLNDLASAPTLSSRDGIQLCRQIGRHGEDKFHGVKSTLGLKQYWWPYGPGNPNRDSRSHASPTESCRTEGTETRTSPRLSNQGDGGAAPVLHCGHQHRQKH